MSIALISATLYATLCGVVILFHLAMALGAPWGHLTMGGKYPGRLVGRVRLLPVLSAGILVLMSLGVMDAAGMISLGWPDWAFWGATVGTLLTTLANLATPSRPERRLWGPLTVVMCLCLLMIILAR